MARVGTITRVLKEDGSMVVKWGVTSGAAAGNWSPEIDCAGYDVVEYYSSVFTGISAGTHEIGMMAAEDFASTLREEVGRHARSDKTTVATTTFAGYCLYPPRKHHFTVVTLGTSITAYEVTAIYRPTNSLLQPVKI